MAVNRDLLLKVKEKILAEPGQFIMEDIFATSEQIGYTSDLPREVPNCGTAACIAGWAVSLAIEANPKAGEKAWERLEVRHTEVMGITRERFDTLCFVYGWPRGYADRWRSTRDLTERAKIAAQVIDLRLAQWAAEDATTEEEK